MTKVTKKDGLMEKKIKGLEKRVDCNAQVNRDKSMSKRCVIWDYYVFYLYMC